MVHNFSNSYVGHPQATEIEHSQESTTRYFPVPKNGNQTYIRYGSPVAFIFHCYRNIGVLLSIYSILTLSTLMIGEYNSPTFT